MQKKVDELEAKTAFLLKKASKASTKLKEVKEDHHKALDKLNVALTFNQKLEAYVGHTGDVVNKARLFDAKLTKNPDSAEKIILVLVDFVEKMEELLDKMRVLFDGLQPKVPPVAAENLPDILGEIPSLTGWRKEAATETPTKPDQPRPSEPTREEEVPTRLEHPTSPRRHTTEPAIGPREVPVNMIVADVVRELEMEQSQAHRMETTPQPARIDTTQIRPEEVLAEQMRELPTPPSGPTSEPILVVTPRSLVRPFFLSRLERITQSPFKIPGSTPNIRLPVSTPTPASTGPDTQDKPEASGSRRSTEGGAEATSLAARVTRSTAKQTPGPSSLPKRPYFSPTKESSSKHPGGSWGN